jgi:hypothetical protein
LRHRRGKNRYSTPEEWEGYITRLLLQNKLEKFLQVVLFVLNLCSQRVSFLTDCKTKKRKRKKEKKQEIKTSSSKPLPSWDGGASGHISK